MALLSRVIRGTPPEANPGRPVRDVVSFADNVRGSVIDWPILVGAIGILYNMAFIQGEDETWSLSDVFIILVTAWAFKRLGVARRWQGVPI